MQAQLNRRPSFFPLPWFANSHQRFILQKYFAPRRASRISSILGSWYAFFVGQIFEFTIVHEKCIVPSFFLTRTIGEHQGPELLVSIPSFFHFEDLIFYDFPSFRSNPVRWNPHWSSYSQNFIFNCVCSSQRFLRIMKSSLIMFDQQFFHLSTLFRR